MDKNRRIIHQGGVAIGYIEGNAATIDADFYGCAAGRELIRIGVPVAWKPDVANRLRLEADCQVSNAKHIRIYQLISAVSPEKKFITYEHLCELYGGPRRTDYHLVYDGSLEFEDLDALYETFTEKTLPKGYTGRKLSMSDIIELCSEEESILYYVDAEDYILINWKEN